METRYLSFTFEGFGIGLVYERETKKLRIDIADSVGDDARIKRLLVNFNDCVIFDDEVKNG